ncbi:MAG TPA: HK97 family phage prohead protease [Geminicoccus sp.]|jgi:HK97 family phage prohead protease|uniref:HK97 family phage prohead protease n=1 Tax=Geminicoccus sp. TaxID=2024832 RepID=UPI002E375A2B|nr:HK97 family phage prohead protease [Geminicoccus sp.]HEX2525300.1 HK97 family phage prohead protease [Geminicoccus sp.]
MSADGLEPLKIRGYAACTGLDYRIKNGIYERIEPGAFAHQHGPVYAALSHDPSRRYAWTGNGSLRLWEDHAGLAFELDVTDRASAWLASRVACNEFRACSIMMKAGSRFTHCTEFGRSVQVMNRIHLDEISLCHSGANPGAACWLDVEEFDDIPAGIRVAWGDWHAGYQAYLKAKAPSRPRTVIISNQGRPSSGKVSVPSSVIALLKAGPPMGWGRWGT